jgi:transcriptional regulator with XRE-family HTH domain
VPIEETFGEVPRECRRERGLTQDELAFQSGYSRNYIGLLEGGKRSPTLSAITRLAEVLRMAPSELVRRAEERASAAR